MSRFHTSARFAIIVAIIIAIVVTASSLSNAPASPDKREYRELYFRNISALETEFGKLEKSINRLDTSGKQSKSDVLAQLHTCRRELKKTDFWTRYLEGNTYRSLNGPLPVEWETEVFEKFEKPYKREGAGLFIIENMVDSNVYDKAALKKMLLPSLAAMPVYKADSITENLATFDHFFLCNRLFLLNLSAIYTTGFECPDDDSIIPELREMLAGVGEIYSAYNSSFRQYPLPKEYLELYEKLEGFANSQPANIRQFDHFAFIRDYINPLFALNQQYIRNYKVVSNNLNDYTLNNDASSIFNKDLYNGQNTLGIYSTITDPKLLARIKNIGKTLFYDPILSGNNQRSCASCHKPTQCFTDTCIRTALNFNRKDPLPRNTPSLVNVVHHHLLMLDGKHISLQGQAQAVITNPDEMGGTESDVVRKVMSCREYKEAFDEFKKYTYQKKEVAFYHIISAVTAYVGDFSNYSAPFDDMMNGKKEASAACKKGFNLFMGKALCGTCHYIPEFSGVRPPFLSSEFEVIGVPADTGATRLDPDSGRAGIYYADEMFHAFRTNTVRNSGYTKPYMHNGVFNTMQQVLDFYNAGGGAGKGLSVPNQTVVGRPLKLTKDEMNELLVFISSLDENIIPELPPAHLPASRDAALNSRKVGGVY